MAASSSCSSVEVVDEPVSLVPMLPVPMLPVPVVVDVVPVVPVPVVVLVLLLAPAAGVWLCEVEVDCPCA
ncbi:MAG: hypothetical protein JOZ55_02760 [Alphaproteobacteria bacterium]|nr:hypothetical protein [Alphaproteobacteria bacterium]